MTCRKHKIDPGEDRQIPLLSIQTAECTLAARDGSLQPMLENQTTLFTNYLYKK